MNAKWISPPPVYGKASLYNFTKKFTADGKPKSFLVRISAETRYRLYINGKEICHGPCKSTKFVKHYEELDCAYALKEGTNEIKVVVLHISPQEGHRFSTTCPRDRAALYFDGTVVTDKGEEKIQSKESLESENTQNSQKQSVREKINNYKRRQYRPQPEHSTLRKDVGSIEK